jgi:hypothetical protein
VKLTASGETLTRSLEVKADPRIKLSAAVLAQQNQLEVRLAELLGRSAALALEAKSVAEQVGKLAPEGALKAQVAELAAKVTALRSGPPERDRAPADEPAPSLGGVYRKIQALYGAVEVDAVPTAAVIAETAKAERELDALARSWAALAAGALARLNAALAAARLLPITPDRRAPAGGSGGNSDEE